MGQVVELVGDVNVGAVGQLDSLEGEQHEGGGDVQGGSSGGVGLVSLHREVTELVSLLSSENPVEVLLESAVW